MPASSSSHPDSPSVEQPSLESLPPELSTIQPGGGHVMQLELAWGRVRRTWLRWSAPKYLARMRASRKGDRNPTPHEVLDPRDVKYYINQPGGYYWNAKDDPFTWRNQLPFARWGLAELVLMTALGAAIAAALAALAALTELPLWANYTMLFLALSAAVATGLIVWFFRDPHRAIPTKPGQIVSPADGTVAEVAELDFHPHIGGPAVRVGIFLSIFNVHVNRWPMAGRVIGIDYKAGKYLNALNPRSVLENEQLHVRLETTDATDGQPRRMVLHLIAGLIARRIVCILKPGDRLSRGDRIGMIKLGSRTEIIFPQEPGLVVHAKVGQKIHGGYTVVAEYDTSVVVSHQS